MTISLKILDSNQSLKDKILGEIQKKLAFAFVRAVPSIEKRVKAVLINSIKGQPEYDSLKYGALRHQLGLDNASERVNAIVDYWEESLYVQVVRPVKNANEITGKIIVYIADSQFSNERVKPEAIIVPDKTPPFCWLEFLLLEGDASKLAPGYGFVNKVSPKSRSGRGLMIRSASRQWKIPSEFTGVVGNNWFTRALESVRYEIDTIMFEELNNAL